MLIHFKVKIYVWLYLFQVLFLSFELNPIDIWWLVERYQILSNMSSDQFSSITKQLNW